LLDFNEKIVFQLVSAIRVQIWFGVDFALVRCSLSWSSDFSLQPDSFFPVDSPVCILVVTLSRDSVPVRPAASFFSSSWPCHRSATLWICERVLVSGCSSSLGSCTGQLFLAWNLRVHVLNRFLAVRFLFPLEHTLLCFIKLHLCSLHAFL
jgi:hypothetical protein